MKKLLPLFSLVSLCLLSPSHADVPISQPRLRTVMLSIDQHPVESEIAETPTEQEIGMMGRFSIAPGQGMLFVFPNSEKRAFWMRNTTVPLSIAYVGSQGTIINIEDMQPLDERPIYSRAPAQYALEVKRGWFAANGIRPGMKIQGLDKIGKKK